MAQHKERRAQERREEAEHRQRHYDNLTDKHRLEALERRGHGHCQQAKELRTRISA